MDGTSLLRLEGSPVLVLDEDDLRSGLVLLRWHLGRLLEEGPPALLVDISGLTGLSSTTVATLLRARRMCRARGGRLVLHGPHRDVLALLRRSGLVGLFDVTTGDLPQTLELTSTSQR